MKFRRMLASAALAAAAIGLANADVIDFGGLSGLNFDPMPNPYTEDGYNVAPIAGDWFEAHLFGNPTPDIFSTSELGVVKVTSVVPGGKFQFASVDLGDAGGGGANYIIDGLLAGVPVFSTGVGGPLVPGFTTVGSPSNAEIDELQITIRRGPTSSYNIDNINIVPEPASMLLLAVGGLAMLRRKR